MAEANFAQAQRQRDEHHLAALYQQHAEALARTRAQDDELERTRRAFESATTSARIARLDLEIAERALKQHIDAISERSAAISPIQRLPSELLLRIFRSRSLDDSCGRCQSSFIVAGTCRRWRKLALESTALWSIYLDLVKRPVYAAEYVRAVLARSGNQSLVVTVLAPQQLGAEMVRDLNEILPDVITRANYLSILACHPTLFSGHQNIDISTTIFKFLQLPTPQLAHLMILGTGVRLGDARLLPAAPLLAFIELVAYPLSRLPAAPLQAVQVLDLEGQYELPDMALLHEMVPNVRRLIITRLSPCHMQETPVPVHFAHLEHLELDGIDLLSSFPHDGLPALTCLIVGSGRFADDNSLPPPATITETEAATF
ncbi:hypothetical protein EXIGLDRAFT_775639 [Exidia glandulosa HHB12029]|uniref:F-box domain-containing protein n=1 Tax=Exidia glandulosa HHB12029 TaxID=1314781 RepID=A0A165ZRX8_EXIGL|nr:hypothetical protein EXIGLDRAFT_775639 [Exidia glandulosa HHB12029]